MNKLFLILIIFVAFFSQTKHDVVDQIWNHIGGKNTFEKARYVEFDWRVMKGETVLSERHHLWDRFTGDYVLSYPNKEKKNVLVKFNTKTKLGSVSVDNTIVEDASKYINDAYKSYINDTYWLIVPTKLQDEGVQLELEKADGQNVLSMSFGKVGLTPGDTYKLFVDGNGKITKWTFTLENGRKGEFAWNTYVDCNMGLNFSTEKVSVSGISILTNNVKFSKKLDQNRFK